MAYVVSGLTDYVQTNADLLIKKVMFGGRKNSTIANMAKQLGVKTKERLNYFDVNPVLQSGRGCGFSASGSTVLSDRDIEVAIFKVNDNWCPDNLLEKFYENEVAIAAGQERLPFEEEITSQTLEGINDQMEKLIWQGDKTANNDLIDGLITIAEGADSASTITVTAVTSAMTVYKAVEEVYKNIPEQILDKAVIFVSPALYRQYILDLVVSNLYHYDPSQGDPVEMFIPGGQNVKVRKADGLAGTKKIYASAWENMVYATDGLNDKEEFKLWFSDDDDVYKLKVRWAAGVATYFPDLVVLADMA